MLITDFYYAADQTKNPVDWVPAVAAAVAAIKAGTTGGDFTIRFPAGQWYFYSTVFLPCGISIEGDHKMTTVLNKNFNAGAFIQVSGAGGGPLPNYGGAVRKCSLWAVAGFTASFGLYLLADSVNAPDYFMIDEVNVTGPSSTAWTTNLYIDGHLRSSPAGCRDMRCRDSDFIGASNQWWYLNAVIGLLANNCGFFVATGSNIAFDGGGVGGNVQNCRFASFNGVANQSGAQGWDKIVAPSNCLYDGDAI